jgi:5-methylcytosine-specific restriction endonuclease McrA
MGRCKPCHLARNKADRALRAESGMCVRCGVHPAATGKRACGQCSSVASEWRIANRQRYLAYNKAWKKAHPESKRVSRRIARRRREARVRGGSLRAADIKFLLKSQKGKCAVCRVKLTRYDIDHVIPLAAGGLHDRHNVQLLCPDCNNRKGAKDPMEFMRSEGFLL